MSRAKLYYSVFETETHFEYHCSADRELIMKRGSMSRRILKDSPEAATSIMSWLREAELYESQNVPVHSHYRKPA